MIEHLKSAAMSQQSTVYIRTVDFSDNSFAENSSPETTNSVRWPPNGLRSQSMYQEGNSHKVQSTITQYGSTVYIGIAMVYPH